jgi:hypothetical protein
MSKRKKPGAWGWEPWTLEEARRQEQLEMFVLRSVDPRKAEQATGKKRRWQRRKPRVDPRDHPAAGSAASSNGGEKMPRVSSIYGGQFMTAAELMPMGKRHPALIHGVVQKVVSKEGEEKLVLTLASAQGRAWPRELVLNKGNATALQTAYGDDSDDWLGKPIELWAEMTSFQGKNMPGIRLAATAAGTAEKAAPVAGNGEAPLNDEIPF